MRMIHADRERSINGAGSFALRFGRRGQRHDWAPFDTSLGTDRIRSGDAFLPHFDGYYFAPIALKGLVLSDARTWRITVRYAPARPPCGAVLAGADALLMPGATLRSKDCIGPFAPVESRSTPGRVGAENPRSEGQAWPGQESTSGR